MPPADSGRRRLLAGLSIAAVSTLVGGLVGWRLTRPAAGSAPDDRAAPSGRENAAARGSLEWALALASAPEDELLSAAGDLERVSAQHRREALLAPCFERLLEVALGRSGLEADMAGACAVRSLARLRRADAVLVRRAAIELRTDLEETRAALAAVIARERR